jgi:hypothetical protein
MLLKTLQETRLYLLRLEIELEYWIFRQRRHVALVGRCRQSPFEGPIAISGHSFTHPFDGGFVGNSVEKSACQSVAKFPSARYCPLGILIQAWPLPDSIPLGWRNKIMRADFFNRILPRPESPLTRAACAKPTFVIISDTMQDAVDVGAGT